MIKRNKNLTDRDFKIQEQKMKVREDSWNKEKELLERQYKLQEERRNLRPKSKITTTKWIILFLFINCTAIEIFTGWSTYKSLMISEMLGTYADFSPLVALIGAVIGEVMGFAVYAVKSKAENTEGGVTYLQVQQELNQTMITENPDAAG